MALMLEHNRTPDLVGELAGQARALELELAPSTILELDDAVTAILDREERAGPDERARLRRVRYRLERELSDRLAE